MAQGAIVVMAAVADLCDDLGWPRELVEVETARYVFDFAAFGPPKNGESLMIIAGEAKRSAAEADSWLRLLFDCLTAPDHQASTHTRPSALNAHKKYIGLLADHPTYFWLVAPRFRSCFTVRSSDASITLVPAGSSPPQFSECVL